MDVRNGGFLMPLFPRIVLSSVLLLAVPLLAAPSTVTLDGHQLIVRKRLGDGSLGPAHAYVIRGMFWAPAGKFTDTDKNDVDNVSKRRAEFGNWVATDAPLLAAMNVNTVVMPIDPGTDGAALAILDVLYANGIMAAITVDEGSNDLARVDAVVAALKNHPAVLGWMLGNEWNINRYFTSPPISVHEAAERTQTAAEHVKAIDPDHPVISSYGDIDIAASGMTLADTETYVNDVCTSVDLWALNIYRGNSFGTLFSQWASITEKPMFVGEYGTDAFRTLGALPAGLVDETMQRDWSIALWDELFGHLSANVPEAVAIGGVFFEFTDEWWKVALSEGGSPFVQDTGGTTFAEHPDEIGNEEFFGLADIDRNPRLLYTALQEAFEETYQPPGLRRFRAVSRGSKTAFGYMWMFQDGAKLAYRTNTGNPATTGRGINVAVIDPATGELQEPVRNFDTWAGSHAGTNAFCELDAFLEAVSDGMLLLLAAADDTGFSQNFPESAWCVARNDGSCAANARQQIQALGSTLIDDYCYRYSWAMAAIKGTGVIEETLSGTGEVDVEATLPVPTRTVTLTIVGEGAVHSVPAGPAFRLGTSVTLHALPAAGATFASWGDDCAGTATTCTLMISSNRTVTATFVSPPASVDAWFNGSAASITWPAMPGAASYDVERSENGSTYVPVGSPSSSSAVDVGVMVGKAYLYRVRSRGAEGLPSAWSAPDLLTAIAFVNDPLVTLSTLVRAVHVTQLRSAANAVRMLAGLAPATFTDPSLTALRIRAVHITDVRSALDAARAALGLPPVSYARAALTGLAVNAVDVMELREGAR